MNEPVDPKANEGTEQSVLIRDAAMLQLKLIVDGVRDFLLVPASLIAALISLISNDGGDSFYRLVRLARRTERWIDLFGAFRNAPAALRAETTAEADDKSFDELMRDVEARIMDEYRDGDIGKRAKERFDQLKEELNRPPRG